MNIELYELEDKRQDLAIAKYAKRGMFTELVANADSDDLEAAMVHVIRTLITGKGNAEACENLLNAFMNEVGLEDEALDAIKESRLFDINYLEAA